jgi:outer membrane biosynthesis protein TonB
MADFLQQKRTSRLSAILSLVFHAAIILALAFFAAREGMLGEHLRKISVTMVPKEKPPEPPKEKPAEPKPSPEPARNEAPKTVPAPKPELARAAPVPAPQAAAPASSAPSVAPSVAPPPAEIPSFDFDGGKPVESSSDPSVLYKSFVEYTLRSHWARPEGVADNSFAAEVEVTIGPEGRLLDTAWKQGSGNAAWDDSVRKVLSETPSLERPPPKGFPQKVLVRFDVEAAAATIVE